MKINKVEFLFVSLGVDPKKVLCVKNRRFYIYDCEKNFAKRLNINIIYNNDSDYIFSTIYPYIVEHRKGIINIYNYNSNQKVNSYLIKNDFAIIMDIGKKYFIGVETQDVQKRTADYCMYYYERQHKEIVYRDEDLILQRFASTGKLSYVINDDEIVSISFPEKAVERKNLASVFHKHFVPASGDLNLTTNLFVGEIYSGLFGNQYLYVCDLMNNFLIKKIQLMSKFRHRVIEYQCKWVSDTVFTINEEKQFVFYDMSLSSFVLTLKKDNLYTPKVIAGDTLFLFIEEPPVVLGLNN